VPRQIQQYAQGLFDLLNIKQGTTLEQMEDELQGTLDLTDIYAAQELIHNGTSAAWTTVNQTVNFTVPIGQLWFVYGFSVQVTIPGIGDTIRFAAQIDENGLFLNVSESVQITSVVANENTAISKTFERPLIAHSGTTFTGRVRNITLAAGSATAQVIVRYARVGPSSK